MSSYACPGCGNDAPLSEECQRCEGDYTRENLAASATRMRKRLAATRAALLSALAINRIHEGAARPRLRAELRLLRERLAEYERPVDDKALQELIYYVESEHSAFALAERGEGPAGHAAWCGNCDTFILALRKLAAAARPVQIERQIAIGQQVACLADRTGRVVENPYNLGEYFKIPAGTVGRVLKVSALGAWAEFQVGDRYVVAEFRSGDVELRVTA